MQYIVVVDFPKDVPIELVCSTMQIQLTKINDMKGIRIRPVSEVFAC